MKKEKNKEKKSKKRLRVDGQKSDRLLASALEKIGGKWKLRILMALGSGESLRYGELRGRVAGITDMMLSQSLKELCAAGLTERHQYQQIPPRVEYQITDKAEGALQAAVLLCGWAEDL
ncbi:MAG: helix-turn-helix transcriptional regulator [Oscillospiraceae bacterium]|jgi:DNA-binding HxlR family transcriptional regulator|nr:helix-turn-helix transcriptional regulator [Oscillospiraceae bacterium]